MNTNPRPRTIERFAYRGLRGCACVCDLEITILADGRTAAIAIEREDNPGTSITNVAEHLASHVCDTFGIDPTELVWIEHYGYPAPGERKRTYDRVTFAPLSPETIRWAPAVTRHQPSGWPGNFGEPDWHRMTDEDWRALGLPPRASTSYGKPQRP